MLCKLIFIRLRGLGHGLNSTGKKWFKIVLPFLLGYAAVCSLSLFYVLFSKMAEALHATPLQWFYFALVGLMSFGMSTFLTMFSAKSELFEAKDTELLLPLPIKPTEILFSRLAIFLGIEYLTSFLITVPAGIAWGVQAGIRFLPGYILGCISLPLLGAAIASVFGWLLAFLTANTKRKNLLTILFSFAFFLVYMIVFSNIGNYVNQFLFYAEEFSESMIGWGFLFHWFGLGIAEGDILLLLAVLAIAVVAFAIALWVISHRFLHLSSRETVHKKNRAPLVYRTKNAEASLLGRELRRLFSSPVYLLNCGLGVLMILMLTGFALVKSEFFLVLTAMLPQAAIACVCALAMCMLCSMCCFTAPSISMEGKNLWILRSAPIDVQKILNAKLYMHLILTAPVFLMLSVTVCAVLSLNPAGWALCIVLPQLMNLFCAQFGLMINLIFPKLTWTNESEPVKQSLSVLLTMLVPMFLPLGCIVAVLFLRPDMQLFSLAALVLLTLLNVLCAAWLSTRGTNRFNRL